jgi:ribosomal protein S18 acetylase RimI-like enzyme
MIQAGVPHIRKVNVRRDLLSVADLIEICFANTLDDDGREYLRQMRWAARDLNYLSWLQGAAERIAAPLYGFVWEEHGHIVGNLSLIPIIRRGRATYLIANVAVHPDYRRRGIGQQLTLTALDHLRERGVDTVWLQVRADNPVAYHLYRSLGFVDRARRATWQSSSGSPPYNRSLPPGVEVHPRRMSEWRQQAAWLGKIYPPEIAWNMSLDPARFRPNLLRQFFTWLRGETQSNWVARVGARPIGFASWEPLRSASDPLWLATTPAHEEKAILSLLPYARSALAAKGKPLSVNYPANRGEEAFQRAGFSLVHVLVWMNISLDIS